VLKLEPGVLSYCHDAGAQKIVQPLLNLDVALRTLSTLIVLKSGNKAFRFMRGAICAPPFARPNQTTSYL
jgi:hypothetical protein